MNKRLISSLLAFVLILQIFIPSITFAKEDTGAITDENLINIGEVSTEEYPSIDTKLILERNREVARNRKQGIVKRGVTLKKSDYVQGGDPSDSDKPKYFGRVSADLITKGLDNGEFNWGEIFGKDSSGAKKPVRIEFHQLLNDVPTGIQFSLEVDKNGTYSWKDGKDNKTLLPLYSIDFKSFKYSVFIDKGIAEKVKLIISLSAPTPDVAFQKEGDRYVADIKFKIDIQQVAATNFSSVWKTDVAEADRPQIIGKYVFTEDGDDIETPFNFPKNETSRTVIRDGFVENFVPDETNDILAPITDELINTPTEVKVDETNANGLTFDTTNKTVKSGDHKFKYDFKYDVINGGKLTMTEIIPVTFDANGGKFASITEEGAEQKIVKEVEYGTLTDKAENPKKDLETFKGWSDTEGGKTPATDEAFKNITKAKTFYAIWDNNDIQAEELEVKESFKDGTGYVNDFIPTLDQLKGQVKIKDANNSLKDITTEKFEILNDSGVAITGDALKDYLYKKLQEKTNPKDEPTRIETVKAKVTFANNNSKTVDIPIKVVKNIYEAKTLTEKPYYVPFDYVKVIVDPTTKATDPQKTYYYVNKEAKVVIPGENPTGKNNYTFDKWLIKGTTSKYELAKKPRHQFSGDTTIEAQYVSNIVPQIGNDKPNVPTDFVLVEFKAGTSGSIASTETTKYWVKPNAGIKLSDITHPSVNVNDGYKHNGWDKVDTTPITEATEVTAQYLKKVLTKEPTDDIKDKYVKVTFKQGDHGTIANTEQTQYWVLKQEKVELKGPAVTAKTGYAQKTDDAAWSPKVAKYYYEDTVHIAQYKFNGTDVIPQIGNDKPTTVPEGYVLVEFSAGNDGKFDADQTTKYWVNPNKEVTLPAPKITPNTGYVQQERLNAWDKYLTATFTEATTIKAQYNKLDDILTVEKPGYVKVEFKAGNNGHLDGTQTYWVNPLKGKKLADVTHPNVKADDGWSHNGWDLADTTAIDSNITSPLVVKAQYLEKVLTEAPTVDADKYVTVEFKQGDHGTINAGQTEKYWVLKNAEVSLTAPRVTPATGYAQITGDEAWSPKQATKYNKNTIHVAQYVYTGDDVVPAGPNGTKPAGTPANFVLVTFEKGDNGDTITGQTQYWVNPDKEVTLTAPSVTANRGYEQKPGFNAWDKYLTATFKQKTTITAQYNKLGDILTEEKPGYVKVEFKQGTNGTLDGTTVYWVNPAANKKLSDIRHPKVTADDHWKHVGWDLAEDTVIKEAKEVTAKYLKDVLTSDPSDTINYVKVEFTKGDHGTITGQAVYWVLKNTEVTLTAPTVTPDIAKGFEQKGGKDAWSPEIATAYSQNTTHVAQYKYQGKNVIPQTGIDKPANVPNDFVKVTFKPTDKAAENVDKIFWVKPSVEVTIPIAKPVGKEVAAAGTEKAYKWQFTKWISTETATRTWDTNIDTGITAIFKIDTEINAEYKKVIIDKGTVVANEITVHESLKKNATEWVNKFIDEASEDVLKKALKVTDDNGQLKDLPTGTTVEFLDNNDTTISGDQLKNYLYDKLQEKDDGNKPSRTEKLKARVTMPGAEVQTVEIPIKVIKNIYEAKTLSEKPYYVPTDYVKVILDPTTNAKDPQKTYYYVNPAANVLITKDNPVGVGTNTFVKWANGNTEYKLAQTDNERYQFNVETTITAEYTTDVIEQTDPNNKPNTVPSNFVKVTFKPTNEATDTTDKIYWVNPTKEVTFQIADPVGAGTKTFKEWKLGSDVYKSSTPKKFTDINGTIITATYVDDVLTADASGNKPAETPDDYVKVTTKKTDKAKLSTNPAEKEEQIFYVNPNKKVKLPVTKPVGKTVPVSQTNQKEFTWEFTEWKSDENGPRTWSENVVADGIEDKFPVETTITAQYEKVTIDQGNVSTEGLTVAESFKDGNTWINNFIPSEVTLKKAIKVKDASGNEQNVPTDATVAFILGKDANGNAYADLATELYDKLKEKDETEVSRIEKIKAKVTFANGEVQDVDIPIKVIKNIYEAKTKEGKPIYVPDGYKKVTVDPTTKAKDPQKTYFYVNPDAKVLIPVENPTAINGYKFINWIIPGTPNPAEYEIAERHQFNEETIIKANYTGAEDIIEYDPNNPTARPEGYVLVRFEAEAGLKLAKSKAFFIKKGAKNTSGLDLTLAALKKPNVNAAAGYAFDTWDTADAIVINNRDIVVTAKVKQVSSPGKPGGEPGYRPYPEIIYRDKIVEKEKIVEKIVKVGENDELLKEIRYMQGFNGKFRPYDGLRRCEAAQILANALKADGYRYDANYALSYSDVGNVWYTDAIRVVTQAGVFQGYSDGTFKPEGKITRAEWVATLRRFQDIKEASGNTMMLRNGHWATAEVEAAYEAGWLGVYQDGTAKFDADKPITRQEVAYVSNRAFRRVLDKVYLKRSVNTLLTYKDINPSMPLYEDILCASNTLLTDNRYYKANTVVMDNLTFNIVTDYLRIQQKKFQYNVIR